MADTTRLGNADWIVLGGYFALLIGSGIWFSRRKVADTRDYFLANRSMPAWAVAISILATAQSAATFVGVPQSSYAGNLAYLASNIGGIIAAVILATVFIPAYYRLNVTTPYALLERRFGPRARTAASWAYLVGRVFASGARVFVGALPACLAIFGDVAPVHMCITIWVFIAFGVAYTFVGGVSSAIWTDVLQVSVYIGAALVTIAVLLHRIPVGPAELIDALAHPPQGSSKLTIIQPGVDFSQPWWGFDPGAEFTLLTVTTGFVLLTLASHGMDQDLVQRMLTCRDAAAGARSVIGGVLVGIPAVCIFLVVGLLLYVFYQRPDIMGAAAPAEAAPSDKAFQTFAYTQMGGGLAGLFLAGLFAAGPAGINSGLNSMASTFVEDVYRRVWPDRDERHYLKAGRAAVVAAGVLLGLFACACILLYDSARNSLLGFVLGVMSFAYAGLLGMFFTALFTRRGSTRSVIAGWFAGFAVVALLEPVAWKWWTSLLPNSLATVRDLSIAFPWRLVLATLVSFAVCLLGNSPARRAVQQPDSHRGKNASTSPPSTPPS
jgi:SSS family solute:Na+ symporter